MLWFAGTVPYYASFAIRFNNCPCLPFRPPNLVLLRQSPPGKWNNNFITLIFQANFLYTCCDWYSTGIQQIHFLSTDSFSDDHFGRPYVALFTIVGCMRRPPPQYTSNTYIVGFLFSFGTESVNGGTCHLDWNQWIGFSNYVKLSYWFFRSLDFPKYCKARKILLWKNIVTICCDMW